MKPLVLVTPGHTSTFTFCYRCYKLCMLYNIRRLSIDRHGRYFAGESLETAGFGRTSIHFYLDILVSIPMEGVHAIQAGDLGKKHGRYFASEESLKRLCFVCTRIHFCLSVLCDCTITAYGYTKEGTASTWDLLSDVHFNIQLGFRNTAFRHLQ